MRLDKDVDQKIASVFTLRCWRDALIGHRIQPWAFSAPWTRNWIACGVYSYVHWVCTYRQDDGQGLADKGLTAFRNFHRRGPSQAIDLANSVSENQDRSYGCRFGGGIERGEKHLESGIRQTTFGIGISNGLGHESLDNDAIGTDCSTA